MIDLEAVLLTETIRDLNRKLWSGVVAVSSGDGDVTKGLFLRRGRFVFAASTVEDERLGEFLVRTGRITREQFGAALEASHTPGKRFGQALVDLGAVGDLDLEDLVAEQLHMIALSAFRWTSGRARVEDAEEPIPRDIALPLSTERLLLEGARTYPDPRRLEQALGDLDRRVQRAENERPAFNYRRVPDSKGEKAVLAALRTPRTIRDLLGLSSPRPALVRAVYALLVSGLLEEAAEAPSAGIPAARPAPPPATVPSPAPAAAVRRAAPPSPAPPAPRPVAPPPAAAPPAVAARAGTAPGGVERAARGLLERGEREQALALLRKEVEGNPQSPRGARRLLALIVAQDHGYSPGLERLLLGLLEEDPKDNELRYRLASSYRKAGLGARARLQLKLVLAADPGHAAAWHDLAELEAAEAGGTKGRPRP